MRITTLSLKGVKFLTLSAILFSAYACQTSRPVSEASREPAATGASELTSPTWAVVRADELRKFDVLLAISDIHGQLSALIDLLKASGALAPDSTAKHPAFGNNGVRHLIIVVGDYIGKDGEDSAGVLLFLKELQEKSANTGNRVIVLLGNNDAELLANPGKNTPPDLIKSAEVHASSIKGIREGEKIKPKDIIQSELGVYVKTFPVGAIVGTWMFVHSGFLNVDLSPGDSPAKAQKKVKKYFSDIHQAYTTRNYEALTDEARFRTASPLVAHDWWKGDREKTEETLKILGLTKILVGHEAKILDPVDEIAQNKNGWLIKLDVGMNEVADESKGRILKCTEFKELLQSNPSPSSCVQVSRKGKESPIQSK